MRVFKNLWNFIIGIFSRLGLTLVWLIALGACAELPDLPAILCGILVVLCFCIIHLGLSWPKGWNYDRLAFRLPNYLLLLVGLSLCLLVGDIFWVLHTNTSEMMDYTPDPVDMMVLAIIAFPLIEEFGFRLWFQGFLESKMPKIPAVLSAALLFAVVHSTQMPVPQLLSGLIYGLVLVYTKSVWASIFLHSFHNGTLILIEQIEYIEEQALIHMDRTDNLNLYVAILFWSLAFIGIVLWAVWSKRKQIESDSEITASNGN